MSELCDQQKLAVCVSLLWQSTSKQRQLAMCFIHLYGVDKTAPQKGRPLWTRPLKKIFVADRAGFLGFVTNTLNWELVASAVCVILIFLWFTRATPVRWCPTTSALVEASEATLGRLLWRVQGSSPPSQEGRERCSQLVLSSSRWKLLLIASVVSQEK